MMQRFLLLFTFIWYIALPMGTAVSVLAADSNYGLDDTAKKLGYIKDGQEPDTVYTIIQRVVKVFLGLVGIIFFGLTTYAGFRWMIARGNEELAEKAKHTLEAAVIGMIIIALSYALTSFIFAKFPAQR